jgi:hypothetical protein
MPSFILALAAPTFGQTYQVKDRNGILVVTVEDVRMFQAPSPLFNLNYAHNGHSERRSRSADVLQS